MKLPLPKRIRALVKLHGTPLLVIDKARLKFPVLNVRAPEAAFPLYEALGFRRVADHPFHTHQRTLRRPAVRHKEGQP